MGRALVYFSALLGRLGRALLLGEVGIPPARQTAPRLVWGPRALRRVGLLLSDLGAVPTSKGRAELPASPARVSRRPAAAAPFFQPEHRPPTPWRPADLARPPAPRPPRAAEAPTAGASCAHRSDGARRSSSHGRESCNSAGAARALGAWRPGPAR